MLRRRKWKALNLLWLTLVTGVMYVLARVSGKIKE